MPCIKLQVLTTNLTQWHYLEIQKFLVPGLNQLLKK